MELKKSPKADIEKMKMVFIQVGLILSLGVVLLAFEWTSTDAVNTNFAAVQEIAPDEEMIDVTKQEEVKPPPPPPAPIQVSDVLKTMLTLMTIQTFSTPNLKRMLPFE
jgi:protein TonB